MSETIDHTRGKVTQDFLIEVNKGNVAGHSLVSKFGLRNSVTTNHHHIWNDPASNTNMIFPTVAEDFNVITTVAEDFNVITTGNDTAAGSACRSVVIDYLDASFVQQTVTVPTNAGTQAAGITAIRIIRAYALDNGTYGGTNENLITIQGVTSGNDYGFLTSDVAQTQNTQYCIPASHTGYILGASISMESNKQVDVNFHKREDADIIAAPFTSARVFHEWAGLITPVEEVFRANHVFPEKTDIWADAHMSSGTGIVQFDYEVLLVDNSYLSTAYLDSL